MVEELNLVCYFKKQQLSTRFENTNDQILNFHENTPCPAMFSLAFCHEPRLCVKFGGGGKFAKTTIIFSNGYDTIYYYASNDRKIPCLFHVFNVNVDIYLTSIYHSLTKALATRA